MKWNIMHLSKILKWKNFLKLTIRLQFILSSLGPCFGEGGTDFWVDNDLNIGHTLNCTFLKNNEFWTILYSIVDNIRNKKITFILDQFSTSTVKNEIYQRIIVLIKETRIQLIICSSINDIPMKEEVIKNWQNFF